MGTDNSIDWTASSTPHGEQYGHGLARKNQSATQKAARTQAVEVAVSKRNVLDKLLGDNNLAAFDAGGEDPYNATGRQFRR